MTRTFLAVMTMFGLAVVVAGLGLVNTFGIVCGPIFVILGLMLTGVFGVCAVTNWRGHQ